MMFPNSSFCLLIVNVASMEAIAIQSKDKAMWLPVHFLEQTSMLVVDSSSV